MQKLDSTHYGLEDSNNYNFFCFTIELHGHLLYIFLATSDNKTEIAQTTPKPIFVIHTPMGMLYATDITSNKRYIMGILNAIIHSTMAI